VEIDEFNLEGRIFEKQWRSRSDVPSLRISRENTYMTMSSGLLDINRIGQFVDGMRLSSGFPFGEILELDNGFLNHRMIFVRVVHELQVDVSQRPCAVSSYFKHFVMVTKQACAMPYADEGDIQAAK